jgi:ketosteroid isomerase-like protein
MYHAVVRRKIAGLFAALNKGNYEPILATATATFEHCFAGQHALSGRRTTMAATRAWYERLFRIFPDIRFDIRGIAVSGWPWDTTVTVEWTDFYVLRDGAPHENAGVHLIRLRWGRGVSVRIYCDTKLLLDNLAIQHRAGIAEASLPPITESAAPATVFKQPGVFA